MIAQSSWFERRKYGGWGVSPKTWQGWVYIGLILLPFMIFQALPFWTTQTRLLVTCAWIGVLLFDIVPVMINLKRDEREYKIEAVSERNAAWFMSIVLALGVFYEVVVSAINQEISVNLFLIVALLGGALVKSVSNIVLERRKL